jgi:hypothetical protein
MHTIAHTGIVDATLLSRLYSACPSSFSPCLALDQRYEANFLSLQPLKQASLAPPCVKVTATPAGGGSAREITPHQQTCLQAKIFMVTFAHFQGFLHFDFLQGVYLCGVPFASMNGL